MKVRTYAIGDVHGQLDMLYDAHARIEEDRRQVGDIAAPVVHLGDLTDRGPDSMGVIEFLIRGIAAGKPWTVIKGNHDRMFTGYLSKPGHSDPKLRADLDWLNPRLGGGATLASYGIEVEGRDPDAVYADAQSIVPHAHNVFLCGLPLFLERGSCLFVHAGIRPGVPLAEQMEDDLLWIRSEFLMDQRDFGSLVVHGHTPVDVPEHWGNRVNLDTGAGFGHPLTAAVIEDREVFVLTDEGRVAL